MPRAKPSRTNPHDVQSVPGMPNALKIYRIEASPFWQTRLFVEGRLKRKSTQCVDRKKAIEFAKNFYDSVRLAQHLNVHVHTDTFHACAKHLLARQTAMVARGERDGRINKEDEKKLKKDILPFFATKGVASITAADIQDYVDQLTSSRRLSPSTLSKHVVVIRKVLNEARRRGLLSSLPLFPTISRKDNPRPYFTDAEYKTLRETANRLVSGNVKVRYVPLTEELYDFIIFATNVFVRPSDLKLLQHKHVEVLNKGKLKGVLITPPDSKTANRESLSMPVAMIVYERLKERHEKAGLASDDDYVFFPEFKNRQYALATLRRQFEYVLEEAGLKRDRKGRARTLYSLRHTALMFRLIKGDNIDVFMLARNALTSVDQLERFYLSHAESRMKFHQLQSFAPKRAAVSP
jgi:hypothetical protein